MLLNSFLPFYSMDKKLITTFLILVIFIAIWFYNSKYLEKSISGLWVAPDGFSKEAKLDEMLVYIGDKTSDGFKAFMLLTHEGEVLLSKNVFLKFAFPFCVFGAFSSPLKISGENIEKHIPESMNMELDLKTGKMSWYDGDELYAVLYKDVVSMANSE